MSDMRLTVTFFQSFGANTKMEEKGTLAELARHVQASHAPSKDKLPWLKLAAFGDKRTEKGSLRHDANVRWISGIEADYDAEKMPFDEAMGLLEYHCVMGLGYTSPSYQEAKPRWRILCPFALGRMPDKRSFYLASLNGAFGGIFSHESWTLSQAYYFGNIDGQPPTRTAQVYGHTLDQLDHLDATAIARPAGPRRGGEAAPSNDPGSDARDDSELIRRVITGEGYHPEMCALAARYIGTGMKPEPVAEVLRGLMLSMPEPGRDERWRQRFGQIPDLVNSAAGKFTDQAEARRAVARVTHSARRRALQPAEIKAVVAAEAERTGLAKDTASSATAVTCRPGTSALVVVVEKPIWPAHAAARRRRPMPTSPVGLAEGGASPTVGQPNRPSVRVADRPSELSRKTALRNFTTDWRNCAHWRSSIIPPSCAPRLYGGAVIGASSPTTCWPRAPTFAIFSITARSNRRT
jgi:hypothetical protein